MKKLIFFLLVCPVSFYSFGQTTMKTVKPGSHVMKDDEVTIVNSAAAKNILADFSIEEAEEITLGDQNVSLSNVTLKAKKITLVATLTTITIEGQVNFECDELIIKTTSGLIITEESKGFLTVAYRKSIIGGIKTDAAKKWNNVTIRFEKIN